MNIYLDDSYIGVKKVYAAFFEYTPDKKTTTIGRLWWKETKEEEIPKWEISMDYLSTDGHGHKFTSTGHDKQDMKDRFKSLIEQIKTCEEQWADRVLENAIINGGNK